MRTIRAIFQDGDLILLEPADLPEGTPITLAIVESDDLPTDGIARAARGDPAFDFLADPREDLYSDRDGEAV